jgi:hypothetical protein
LRRIGRRAALPRVRVAAVLILADIVITDLDNPFNGVYNVCSEPFSLLR